MIRNRAAGHRLFTFAGILVLLLSSLHLCCIILSLQGTEAAFGDLPKCHHSLETSGDPDDHHPLHSHDDCPCCQISSAGSLLPPPAEGMFAALLPATILRLYIPAPALAIAAPYTLPGQPRAPPRLV